MVRLRTVVTKEGMRWGENCTACDSLRIVFKKDNTTPRAPLLYPDFPYKKYVNVWLIRHDHCFLLPRAPSPLAHCAIDNERRTDGRPDRRMASNSSNFKGGNGSRLRNCCTRTTPNTSASGAALLDLPSSTQVVTFMYRARLKAGPRFA